MSFLDRYHGLLGMIELSSKGEEVDLERILQEATVLFQEFQVEYKKAEESERKELVKMMEELQKRLDEHEKGILSDLDITEEELLQISENKENFTPSQWAWMERANKSIASAGRGVEQAERKEKKPAKIEGSKPQKKKRRLKQSKWLKS